LGFGSKGVKAVVLEVKPAGKDGFYNINEKFRKSINTGIITGVKETGAFSENAIKETKDTFTQENLLAGAHLLKGVTKALETRGKDMYFSRYGSWFWGYITLAGIYAEESKK
jgi:hypothetical protein